MEFELTMTSLFAPFLAIFIVLGKVPLLFAKQKLRLRTRSKSSTAKFKNFGSHRNVTNTVFEGVECGEMFVTNSLTGEVWLT